MYLWCCEGQGLETPASTSRSHEKEAKGGRGSQFTQEGSFNAQQIAALSQPLRIPTHAQVSQVIIQDISNLKIKQGMLDTQKTFYKT